MQHCAQVAIWHQTRDQGSLIKQSVRIRLQLLQSNRRFKFSNPQLERRLITIIQVRINNLRVPTSAKFGHKQKVKIPPHRSLKKGPGPAQQEPVVAHLTVIEEGA